MRKKITLLLMISLSVLLIPFQICWKKNNTRYVKIPVLMYHHLMHENEIQQNGHQDNKAILSVERFNEQMEVLMEKGFYTATMEELEQYFQKEIYLPEKTVIITFDDGYFSNIEYAYPVMKENNQSGTIFMIGHLSLRKEDGWLKYIKYNEISKYEDVFCFENHTFDMHRARDNVSYVICEPMVSVREDIVKNMDLFNAKYFSYPYGQYNNKTIEILKETGHKMAFTTKKGYITIKTNPYEIPRFGITMDISTDEFKSIINGNFCP